MCEPPQKKEGHRLSLECSSVQGVQKLFILHKIAPDSCGHALSFFEIHKQAHALDSFRDQNQWDGILEKLKLEWDLRVI